ncbi:MAG: AmmeMemoRadiSam system protein B [bacterium]
MDGQRSMDVRPAGVAGSFYPSEPAAIERTVEGFLSESPSGSGPPPRALVVPHAGYPYSGAVAGAGFGTLGPAGCGTVVLVGPSHLESFGGVSVFPGRAYRTPLGEVPVDIGLAGALVRHGEGAVHSSLNGHWMSGSPRQEHALEVELPFLQVLCEEPPSLVPLVMGEQSWETVTALAEALARAVEEEGDTERVLLAASSDLSHFHPGSRAEEKDRRTLDLIEAFDPRAFHRALGAGEAEACGGGAIASVMLAAARLGAGGARTLAYTHSGHVTGDLEGVVGYAAIRMDG